MSTVICPSCGAALPAEEMTGGWCESCGKKVPVHLTAHAKLPRQAPVGDVTAEEPAEPPARPLPNPMRRKGWLLGAVALAVLMLTLGLVGVGYAVGDGNLMVAGGLIGGVPAVALGIVAVIILAFAGSVDEELAALQRQRLARWTYEPEEWRAFAEADRRRAVADAALTFFVVGAAVAVIAGGSFWLLMGRDPGMALLVGGGAGIGLGGLVGAGLVVSSWLRYRHYRRSPGEAYLGERSVYLAGNYWTWANWGTRLERAEWIEGDPPMLEVTVVIAGRHQTTQKVRVPVPAGRRPEAEEILRRWGAQIG